jgi:hypothetical protein
MSYLRPGLATARGSRLVCQVLEVETKPCRVTLQPGDGGRAVKPQQFDRLSPGLGSLYGRTKVVFGPSTLPFEVAVIDAESIDMRAHGAHRSRRCRNQT